LYIEACKILDEIEIKTELRLIGLSVSNFVTFSKKQLSFFEY